MKRRLFLGAISLLVLGAKKFGGLFDFWKSAEGMDIPDLGSPPAVQGFGAGVSEGETLTDPALLPVGFRFVVPGKRPGKVQHGTLGTLDDAARAFADTICKKHGIKGIK